MRFSNSIEIDYTKDSALWCLYNNKEEKATPEIPPQLHITEYFKKFTNMVRVL